MENQNFPKQQLPNSTLILVFGIASIVGLCGYGVLGLIFGITALVLSREAARLHKQHPGFYTGIENVRIGRIMAIIGIALSALFFLAMIMLFVFYFEDWSCSFLTQDPF